MTIGFMLEENETKITPMKVADALIDSEALDAKDIKELVAYLTVWYKYNMEG